MFPHAEQEGFTQLWLAKAVPMNRGLKPDFVGGGLADLLGIDWQKPSR